ncbi:S2-RNase [Pyrus ussuriensis x Pyrus communis]|uniref:S2-RNase n=1 Tax=Pyrus ussuriensis x Pyrus communis TaxID=2448454 RepID=A0A5N5HE59_9ROSA|nr:S2-RNase [Pyrus ussuriensis x Pyrus communis]
MGASMIRRVQGQHKAHMNSLKVPTTSETLENVKFENVPHEGRSQPHWKSKKENPHPGKYRILKRVQRDMVMMPTPKWSPEPICFGTISPKREIPSPLLVDTLYSTSTYRALLGRDWIHESGSVPSTLHQQVAIYHEEREMRPGFWEMVEAKSRPFLPTANVVKANFYHPSVGILQCSAADKNGCPTKGPEDLPENSELVEFLCVEPDKPTPEVQDPLETIDLGTNTNPRPIQISGLLKTKDRARIINLLHEFKDSFSWHYTEMPGLDPTLVEHKMPIKEGFKPVKQAPRRMSKEIEEKIKEEIEILVKARFIRPTKYVEWLANIVLVLKVITKIVRCCVGYRNINGAMPKDEYPKPMADLSIDAVAKYKVLSFMDGNAGYNQIKMYLVMSFGLKNAGTTYQKAMNAIFHNLISHSMEVEVKVQRRNLPSIFDRGFSLDVMSKEPKIEDWRSLIIQYLENPYFRTSKKNRQTSKKAAIGTTPYALTFGQDAMIPMEINTQSQAQIPVSRQYDNSPLNVKVRFLQEK